MTTPQNKSSDRMDDAIAWSVRLSAPDVSEEQLALFAVWLETDAANREAYERVSAFESNLDDAVAEYAAQVTADTPPLSSTIVNISQRQNVLSRRNWLAGGAALLAACAVLFVALRTDNRDSSAIYATNVGEQKTVTLADGTTIELNTATTLVVAPDGVIRHVTLQRGEALFHVAKDSEHPFLVTVGDRQVRVVGTVFNVRRDQRDVTVVVAEGKVAVGPKGENATASKARERHLLPGDKLVYAADTGTTTVEHVDPARALAWHRGYLVYENAPLAQVIADLNRYFPNPVSLEGTALQTQHFSGVLKIDNETAVLRRLQQFLPLTVKKEADGRIILHTPRKHD